MLRKKQVRFVLALGLIIVMLFASISIAYGKQTEETIKVLYNNIRIIVDGTQIEPKDASGNAVEPFIYNGTTYLPVRAVANALGKEVTWDSKTSTVSLGNSEATYLDQMPYSNFQSTGKNNFIVPFTNMEVQNVKFNRGLKYQIRFDSKDEKTNKIGLSSEYIINGKYKKLIGTLGVEGSSDTNDNGLQPTIINFYGDDKLLYSTPPISKGMSLLDLNIDVSGVSILRIETINEDEKENTYYTWIGRDIIFGETRFIK